MERVRTAQNPLVKTSTARCRWAYDGQHYFLLADDTSRMAFWHHYSLACSITKLRRFDPSRRPTHCRSIPHAFLGNSWVQLRAIGQTC